MSFQFTPVLRRATRGRVGRRERVRVSIHARLATGDCGDGGGHPAAIVSIHARLATGDQASARVQPDFAVSIHARLATGDVVHKLATLMARFQFTPVLRRATRVGVAVDGRKLVSIHARLATGDIEVPYIVAGETFQFTPVLRRATPVCGAPATMLRVSIHARLATGDKLVPKNFRPSFVSIHARLATGDGPDRADARHAQVSIHARLATGDADGSRERFLEAFQFTPVLRRATPRRRRCPTPRSFNSRPSCDGRHTAELAQQCPGKFQFTPVLRRATTRVASSPGIMAFQFTPVLRRATAHRPLMLPRGGFNSRPSCDGRPVARRARCLL